MTENESIQKKKITLSDLKLLFSLWPYIRPYLLWLLLSILILFFATGVDLLIPYLTKIAIDSFIVGNKPAMFLSLPIQSFFELGIVFIIVLILFFLTDSFQSILMERTGQKIILNLRTSMFRHMVHLPVSFFDTNSSGRLVSRVANDIENMNEMFSSMLIFIFKDIVIMTFVVVILFSMDIKLAFMTSLVVPVVIFSIIFFSKISRKAFREIRSKIAEINHTFSETIAGINIIQTMADKNHVISRFKKLNYENFKAGIFQIKIFGIFMPFVEFLNILSLAIIISYGGMRVFEKDITIGLLIAFISYMKMFFRPIRDLSEKFNLLQNALASSERIISILKIEESNENDFSKQKIDKIYSLEFKNVFFAYNKPEYILRDISFSVNRGETIGIAGHTGAGKSSIINLLSGFYQNQTGKILINKRDYKDYSSKDLRKKISVVMQDPILFSGTIRENIVPPDFKISDEKIKEILLKANCNFIFKHEEGLDFILAENGNPLSSGEKQLLCIARAFIFDPDLIVFDEATSYVDSQSEYIVHETMQKLMKEKTSILIAHRLSTLAHADRIIVLKYGQIIESGTNQELLNQKGEFYKLKMLETKL